MDPQPGRTPVDSARGMLKSITCAVLTCASACALSDEDIALDETTQDLDQVNGVSLNGVSLNGVSLNGVSLNGVSLNGVSLNGVSLNGTTLSSGSVSTSPLTGTTIVGSKWTATASNSQPVNLRIDSALQGTDTNADLWFYAISYQTTAGWSPLCGLDAAGAPIRALSVAGVWKQTGTDKAFYANPSTQFTLACRGTSVAKCVELGYKPFKGRDAHLASCVRLLRGDYCGNGTPYTVTGTLLNLYDTIGLQSDNEAWPAEAEWTPTGARCINTNRAQRYELVLKKDPTCLRTKTTTCGNAFSPATLLIDELSPSALAAITSANNGSTN
jgi:ADYC domain/Pentapeptide repeats (8 copies)